MSEASFRKAVRKRPGMYIGGTDKFGANQVVYELVANVVDQFAIARATYCEIEVEGHRISVWDDGPGLPFRELAEDGTPLAEHHLERRHTGPTALGHAPHVHFVHLGVGLAVVNALSSEFRVVSRDGSFEWTKRYQQGVAVGDASQVVHQGESGTRIDLSIDQSIFSEVPDTGMLQAQILESAHLFPGLRFSLNGQAFHNARGLLGLAESISPGEAQPGIWRTGKLDAFWFDIALLGTAPEPDITRSWANGSTTLLGGTHEKALRQVCSRLGLSPAVCLVHIVMNEPQFAGPTKNELEVPHLEKAFDQAFSHALST